MEGEKCVQEGGNKAKVLLQLFPLSLLLLQITDVPIVPPLVLFLAKHPLVDKFDLSSMGRVSSGAAPLGKELEIAMLKRLPKVQRLQQGTWSSKKLW